jgi:hypothetical protein
MKCTKDPGIQFSQCLVNSTNLKSMGLLLAEPPQAVPSLPLVVFKIRLGIKAILIPRDASEDT